MSKLKIFTSILKARLTGAVFPLVAHINVTNSCNLRCRYCYGAYADRQGRDFATDELISLIDELHSLGTRIISLGAGEPLMRPDIEDIISHIRSKGIECRMNTNGHLVLQKLSAVKRLNSICISIDGDEEVHDRRKGKGSFQKVLAAIKIAQGNHIAVHTTTLLSKDNIQTIDSILKLARQMGFFAEFLLPFFQTPEDLVASDPLYREALRKIIVYKTRGYPVFFSLKAHQYALSWPDYKMKSVRGQVKKDFGKYIPCYAGKYMCIIDSDGKVYPCSQMIGEYPALNYLEYGFKRSWEYIQNHDCRTCYAFICFNDYNLLIGLKPQVILNHLKNFLQEHFIYRRRQKQCV